MGDEVIETPIVEDDPIEQVDSVEILPLSEPEQEASVPKEEKVERVEKKEIIVDDVSDVVEIEKQVEEEQPEEEEKVAPPSNKKFGLSKSQRSLIWRQYQKRQTEIQTEALKLNEDRFSKTYLGHVDRELNKLKYNLKKEHNINSGQLDYIIEEGKNGKFDDLIETF